MRVTIKDIARVTGLSTSTVSRALNNSKLISEKTRVKVQEVAKDLGFHFNENARALSSNKTSRIKVFVSRFFTQFESEHFFRKLNENLLIELEKFNMEVIINTSHSKLSGESNLYKSISSSSCDGIIIAHPDLSKEEYEYIKKSKIPVLFLYYHYDFLDKTDDFVGADNEWGGYLASTYLKDYGQKFCTIGCGNGSYEFALRDKGFIRGMKEFGGEIIENFMVKIDFEHMYKFVIENKNILEKVDGIFLESDYYFFPLQKASKDINFKGKFRVIGYDNMEMTKYFDENYKSIDQNLDEIVRIGVGKLIGKINNNEKDGMYTLIKPKLV